MNLIKTYKYRLNPNDSQIKLFEKYLSISRYVYNKALEHKISSYKSNKTNISRFDHYYQLVDAKKEPELSFLKEVHSDCLCDAIDRLHKTFSSFFQGNGFPKFQSKTNYKSFSFKRDVKIKNNKIYIPKIKWVKFFNSRPINGKIKYTTIIKKLNKWYVCISVEYPPFKNLNSQEIGIDMGIIKLATLSDGTFYDNPLFFKRYSSEIRILQRKLARQVKGSNSREKTKQKIAKLWQKIRRSRLDYFHKITTEITKKYNTIYVENLNIKRLLSDNPSNLNNLLIDSSIKQFLNLLRYKTLAQSGTFIEVNPAYTSQKCNECSHISKENRKTQSTFTCVNCGHSANADVNAAKNILSSGRAKSL